MTYRKILIRGGRIWDGTRFISGDVAIGDGKILAIGQAPDDFRVYLKYDAEGAIVSPGLVELHAHLRYLSDPVYEANGEEACFPCGVTTAADAGTLFCCEMPAFSRLKIRMFPPVAVSDEAPDFSGVHAVRAYYGADRVPGIKVYYDRTVCGDRGLAPYRAICDEAHRLGLIVMTHCSDCPVPMRDMFSCMEAGDISTHTYHNRGHSADEDDLACLQEAREKGIILDLGFAHGYHADFALLRRALDRGLAPDTISCDLVSGHTQIKGALFGLSLAMSAMRMLGMGEEEILRAVTSAPANALKITSGAGRLTVGAPADLCVLRSVPADYSVKDRAGNILHITQAYQCALTVADGCVVHRLD